MANFCNHLIEPKIRVSVLQKLATDIILTCIGTDDLLIESVVTNPKKYIYKVHCLKCGAIEKTLLSSIRNKPKWVQKSVELAKGIIEDG